MMAGTSSVGKAGPLAVMAEFLLRGYNVALPEVDVGDDIFVVHDRRGTLWRVQVKTAVGKRRGYGYTGLFAVDTAQLETEKVPDLFYVFVLRAGDRWGFVVIPRKVLDREQQVYQLGARSATKRIFTFRFTPTAVRCARRDLQAYRNNWQEWPLIPPGP